MEKNMENKWMAVDMAWVEDPIPGIISFLSRR